MLMCLLKAATHQLRYLGSKVTITEKLWSNHIDLCLFHIVAVHSSFSTLPSCNIYGYSCQLSMFVQPQPHT